jgi:hypothetical protein
MKVRYHEIMAADCTSDPHPVNYGDVVGDKVQMPRKRLEVMLQDVVDVCESDLVMGVRVVRGRIGDTEYASDYYSESDLNKKGKQAKNPEAKQHKTYGLYFWHDAERSTDAKEVPRFKALPPGLTGLKELARLALEKPKEFKGLSVGVIWTFADSSSCSDYIEIGEYYDGKDPNMEIVNYSCQDWWTDHEGYEPWMEDMSELLGRSFPRNSY